MASLLSDTVIATLDTGRAGETAPKAPVSLTLNHPPPVPDVFDREYATALASVAAAERPSQLVGTHLWLGSDRDRQAGALFVQRRFKTAPSADRVVVAHGTQSLVNILLPGLVRAGGVLAVEELTYPPIQTFAERFGVRLLPLAIDREGIVPDAFEEACRGDAKPDALYLLSTLQNPTTATMSLRRREAIAAIALTHSVPLIEDDVYSILDSTAPPPIATLAPSVTWYLLGTAKSVAAGLKVAYAVAPTPQDAARLLWPGVRATFWMAAPISAAVMTRLIENGGADRIVAAIRDETRQRQELVRRYLQGTNVISKPEALHVWIRLPRQVSRRDLADELKQAGVVVATSDPYVVGNHRPPEAIRIGIGNPRLRQTLESALAVLGQHIPLV